MTDIITTAITARRVLAFALRIFRLSNSPAINPTHRYGCVFIDLYGFPLFSSIAPCVRCGLVLGSWHSLLSQPLLSFMRFLFCSCVRCCCLMWPLHSFSCFQVHHSLTPSSMSAPALCLPHSSVWISLHVKNFTQQITMWTDQIDKTSLTQQGEKTKVQVNVLQC